jgi:uncharacterized repeat protein (TIGR02543 family)
MASESEPYGTSTPLTLNAYTFAGYTFNGWNSEANGGGTSFTNGELVKFNGSATFYAQWTTGTPASTVTFNANGGVGTMASETASVASALTLNTFTRSGYTFNGWNTNSTGGGTSYANGATYPFTTSIIIYAQWTETQISVPFSGSTTPNWSGYVLPSDSAIFTDASAEWTVPTLEWSRFHLGRYWRIRLADRRHIGDAIANRNERRMRKWRAGRFWLVGGIPKRSQLLEGIQRLPSVPGRPDGGLCVPDLKWCLGDAS